MKKLFLSFLPIIFLLFCKPDSPAVKVTPSENNVVIKIDTLYQTKYYSLKDSTGTYTFSVYLNEVNHGVFRYRYKGKAPLTRQINPMKQILKTIFSDSTLPSQLNTLVWGTLAHNANNEFSMAKRLALAAGQSPGWDKKTGQPFTGHENTFVLQLANRAQIYPELTALFGLFGYRISVSGVEKVFILPAEKLPFWNEISGQANKNDKLPFDCLTWFNIEKSKN